MRKRENKGAKEREEREKWVKSKKRNKNFLFQIFYFPTHHTRISAHHRCVALCGTFDNESGREENDMKTQKTKKGKIFLFPSLSLAISPFSGYITSFKHAIVWRWFVYSIGEWNNSKNFFAFLSFFLCLILTFLVLY